MRGGGDGGEAWRSGAVIGREMVNVYRFLVMCSGCKHNIMVNCSLLRARKGGSFLGPTYF